MRSSSRSRHGARRFDSFGMQSVVSRFSWQALASRFSWQSVVSRFSWQSLARRFTWQAVAGRAPWLLTALWLLLPWSVGSVVASATTEIDRPIALTVGMGLWVGWGVALTMSLIRRPWALTVVRVAAPAALAVAVVMAALRTGGGGADGFELLDAIVSVAIAHAVVASTVAFLPEVGIAFVDGLSYGTERRLPLRPPLGVLVGPVPLAWAIVVGGVATGPLFMAARQWVLGIALTVAGWLLATAAVRSLHQLARRWVVFVPNGLVLVDQLALREPLLLLRKDMKRLAPASADVDLGADDLADLTGNAAGVVLQATMSVAVELVPRRGWRAGADLGAVAGGDVGADLGAVAGGGVGAGPTDVAELVSVSRVLFCPTRPGAVLATAAERRIGITASAGNAAYISADGDAADHTRTTDGNDHDRDHHLQQRRQRIRLTVATAAVLAVIAAASALFVSTVTPLGVPSHVVEEYTGWPINEVRAVAETNSWVLDEDQVRSDSIDLGNVISQFPVPGAVLAEGELLNVDVASGLLLVTLPMVVGTTVADAVKRLEDRGFAIGLIAQHFNNDVPEGRVIEQIIDGVRMPENQPFEPGTVVRLTVSTGPLPRNVPVLVGLTLTQARAAVEHEGLTLIVAAGVSANVPELAVVISQDPKAGAIVDESQVVVVRVRVPVVGPPAAPSVDQSVDLQDGA